VISCCWVAGLLWSFLLGLLCGVSGWTRRRFLSLVVLVVPVVLGVVLAWCSVFPERPLRWGDASVLWEFRLLRPSWPFWVGGSSINPEFIDVRILYVADYRVVERWYGRSAEFGHMAWLGVVYLEFFVWLSAVDVVGGVLGFLVSWRVVRRLRLRADEWNGLRFLPEI
jgi:hypothetical protein